MNTQITTIINRISNILLPFQIPHTLQLCESLLHSNCILDASDTGTGKTYTTLALCSLLNLKPLIICPKSVINSWASVASETKIPLLGISNYEQIKKCNYYNSRLHIVPCPYIIRNPNANFILNFPPNTLVVFDEAHRCKNHNTITSKLLLSAPTNNYKILLLSATIIDKLECFRPFGTAFGLYSSTKEYKIWLRKQFVIHNSHFHRAKIFDDRIRTIHIIHNAIFPKFGSRMKISELGDMFPKNQVLARCYHCDDITKVNELYADINQAIKDMTLKDKDKDANGIRRASALRTILFARMQLELIKLPIIYDLIGDARANNYSVAVFVNYNETINQIAKHLKITCIVRGGQSLEERTQHINDFQTNKTNIIICNIVAGGSGISLHDIHGGHPRMSIISPTYNAIDIKQCLGRIFRAGAKTPALQRIVYIARTCEEDVCSQLDKKLSNIAGINDMDLTANKIELDQLKTLDEAFRSIQN